MRKYPENTSPPPASEAVQKVRSVVGTLPTTAMSWLVPFTSDPVTAWSGDTTLYVLPRGRERRRTKRSADKEILSADPRL